MKRLWMAALLASFLWGGVQGQVISYGFLAGVNAGAPYQKPELGAEGTPGLGPGLGPFIQFRLSDRFELQLASLFSIKKAQFRSPVQDQAYTYIQDVVFPDTTIVLVIETFFNGEVEGSFNNEYLDLPLVLWYRTGDHFSVGLGPYASYLLDGENTGTATGVVGDNFTTIEDEPFDNSEYLRNWDFGTVVGANYETEWGLNTSLRLNYGLRSIYSPDFPQETKPTRNIYMQLMLGYRFRGS